MKVNTVVVNLVAGPSAGKSATAARVYALLKAKHVSCELAREVAKDAVYENNTCLLYDELKIFADQNHILHRLKGQVEVIITDSPLYLKLFYKPDTFDMDQLVIDVAEQYDNINFFIERVGPYQTEGRLQTYEEALQCDHKLKELLAFHEIACTHVPGNEDGADQIVRAIMNKIRGNGNE